MRWALDQAELDTLKERADYFGLDKTKNFEDFKGKYLTAAEEVSSKSVDLKPGKTYKKEKTAVENSEKDSIIKLDNMEVRKLYVERVSKILDNIDTSLPLEDQAKQAFDARNRIRTEARKMMADEATKEMLDIEHPNKSFEDLVESKMKRKGLTREEAILDILKTATKTNTDVNKELGIGGK